MDGRIGTTQSNIVWHTLPIKPNLQSRTVLMTLTSWRLMFWRIKLFGLEKSTSHREYDWVLEVFLVSHLGWDLCFWWTRKTGFSVSNTLLSSENPGKSGFSGFYAWFSSEKPGKTGFSEHSEFGFIKMSLSAPPLSPMHGLKAGWIHGAKAHSDLRANPSHGLTALKWRPTGIRQRIVLRVAGGQNILIL